MGLAEVLCFWVSGCCLLRFLHSRFARHLCVFCLRSTVSFQLCTTQHPNVPACCAHPVTSCPERRGAALAATPALLATTSRPCTATCCGAADDEGPKSKEGGELDDRAWRAMEREAEGVALGNGTENLQEVRQQSSGPASGCWLSTNPASLLRCWRAVSMERCSACSGAGLPAC